MVHMMRAVVDGKHRSTRCGVTVVTASVTVWESDVTCPKCIHPSFIKKRTIPRRKKS